MSTKFFCFVFIFFSKKKIGAHDPYVACMNCLNYNFVVDDLE